MAYPEHDPPPTDTAAPTTAPATPARSPPPTTAPTRPDDLLALLVAEVREYAIFALDPGGHVASWNVGAERLKGYSADEILGRHFSVLYLPADRALGRPEQHLATASVVGRLEDEGWRVRPDGTRFWANVVITALRTPDGTLRGFGKVTRDLTAQRAVEHELRAAERLRMQGRIHDDALQLALAASQDVEAAAEGDPEALGHARRTLRALAEQLRLLTGDLRVEERDPTAVEPALRASVAPHVRQAGLAVHLELAPEALAREPDLIFDLARELIVNTAKHARATQVTVTARADRSATTLVVADDGTGIDEDRRRRAGAAGHIGLVLTTGRLRSRGGTLRISSTAGGTTVSATVPHGRPGSVRHPDAPT